MRYIYVYIVVFEFQSYTFGVWYRIWYVAMHLLEGNCKKNAKATYSPDNIQDFGGNAQKDTQRQWQRMKCRPHTSIMQLLIEG